MHPFTKPQPSGKDLRLFGLVGAAILLTTGIVMQGFGFFASTKSLFSWSSWPFWLFLLLTTAALAKPATLRPLHFILHYLSQILGYINSRILLTLFYFLLLTPLGALMRLFGKGLIDKGFAVEKESYFVKSDEREAGHMVRPF